ncbi:MAG: GNAT family N-acetyltransferase [Ruthenibacterium lactatiformans]
MQTENTGRRIAGIGGAVYDTVHTVNAGDYTKEQRTRATGHVDLEAWDRSFREHHTLVALEDGAVIGFGDINGSGYLDRLYVHRRQGKGVATALCDRLQVCAALPAPTHRLRRSLFEKEGIGSSGSSRWNGRRGAHQFRDGKRR